ncbi:tyrosine-type recombinase/integrase [Nonomuraea wenchangensis]|uniref:tyrosine-type recombinase/integrase n=1 Tax=Nonomuraea wenchangensis TaxID=568860 RepID=UPI00341E5060
MRAAPRRRLRRGVDRRTAEQVNLLFAFRARRISSSYINSTVIPMLCRKAGVPTADVRGNITSHRARSTIASQLYNAKEPMTLFELQAWLGHRSPQSTQYYAKITPTTLTRAYSDAGYFERNVRTIEVLIDRDVVESGAAAACEPWQYYDLGHGFCNYTFFEQCPHRMACAKCDFYTPKDASKALLLEAKDNLQRMLAAVPLTDDERAAVDDGQTALDQLLELLADVPTPSGATRDRSVFRPRRRCFRSLLSIRSRRNRAATGPVARQHDGMTDLRWDEVRDFFDPDLMGALPDLFVPDATVEDWQAVLDLIRTRGWQWQYSQGDTILPLPTAAEALARPPEAETVSLRVWPAPGVLAIFRLMSETEIDFDVDLRELQGQEGVDTLCDFLRAIGSELGKPVLMTPEGGSQDPVLGFDPVVGKVVLFEIRHLTDRGRSTRLDKTDSA